MGLAAFTVHATPGDVQVTVNDTPVPCQRVVVDSAPGGVPTVSLWTPAADVTGEGVVQVVRDPTPAEIDAAAADAIRRVNVDEFTARCQAKVRAGRTDPYRVALETLAEMADA